MMTFRQMSNQANDAANAFYDDMVALGCGPDTLDLDCEDTYFRVLRELARDHGQPVDAPYHIAPARA